MKNDSRRLFLKTWFNRGCAILLFFTGILAGCTKFVQVDVPKTQVVAASVFTSDANAVAAIMGLYSQMASSGWASGGSGGLSLYAGLSADEFDNYSATDLGFKELYNNSLSSTNSKVQLIWNNAYSDIYIANNILEGLAKSQQISDAVKTQIQGEAKFVRAFCYFYLVNLYGDIPLTTSSDYVQNKILARSAVSLVYDRIIADLNDAQSLLQDNYVSAGNTSSSERVRPNKSAATALLARVYLYAGNWAFAEKQAALVIAKTGMYGLVNNFGNIFLKNSMEAVWQLMPVRSGLNTNEGYEFVLTAAPGSGALSNSLINSFEAGDKRRDNWVDSIIVNGQTYYFPYKYKVKSAQALSEYYMVLRLSEQYLIRAEASAQQDNLAAALADINIVRGRAGLPGLTLTDKQQILLSIEHERKMELFAEFGHRWFDLKRTNRAASVLAPIKGANWQATDLLYPIPLSDIQNNQQLTQNSGY